MAGRKKDTTIRGFVALDLDTVSVRRIARVSDRLRMGSGAPSAAWTPAAKLHLTLKFMGELLLDSAAPLAKAIGKFVAGKEAPRLGTFGLDAFPSVAEAEVVVAELSDPFGDVAALAAAVAKIANKHGCPPETRPFRPHVTLARLKRPYDARRWLRPELAGGADGCSAAAVALYRSDRTEDGATYVSLGRWEYETSGG